MGGEGCQSFSVLLAPFWTIVNEGAEGGRVCLCFWKVVFDSCFFGLWVFSGMLVLRRVATF